MTFIATVIARDGVAVIADSLVTAMHRTVEERDFLRFLKNKSKKIQKEGDNHNRKRNEQAV